jgi:hypothetical protein
LAAGAEAEAEVEPALLQTLLEAQAVLALVALTVQREGLAQFLLLAEVGPVLIAPVRVMGVLGAIGALLAQQELPQTIAVWQVEAAVGQVGQLPGTQTLRI